MSSCHSAASCSPGMSVVPGNSRCTGAVIAGRQSIRTGNSSARCAITAASTAEVGELNGATTPSPVWLNKNLVSLNRVAQHIVMRNQGRSHRSRVGFPPRGRTLNIGEQERHNPGGGSPADTRTE